MATKNQSASSDFLRELLVIDFGKKRPPRDVLPTIDGHLEGVSAEVDHFDSLFEASWSSRATHSQIPKGARS